MHQQDYSSDVACISFPEREERRSISIHVLTVVVGASWCLRCVPNIRRRSCTRARAGLGFGSDMTRAVGALEKLKLIRGYAGSGRVESRNRREIPNAMGQCSYASVRQRCITRQSSNIPERQPATPSNSWGRYFSFVVHRSTWHLPPAAFRCTVCRLQAIELENCCSMTDPLDISTFPNSFGG